jgi:hypothetical protein
MWAPRLGIQQSKVDHTAEHTVDGYVRYISHALKKRLNKEADGKTARVLVPTTKKFAGHFGASSRACFETDCSCQRNRDISQKS